MIGINETGNLPKVTILSAEYPSVSLLIGKRFCQLLQTGNDLSSEERWLLSWQQTGIKEDDIVNARLQNGFSFTLHTSGNISIFSVHQKKLVAHVNHKDFIHSIFTNAGVLESQETGKPVDFDISPDLQNIIVTYSNVKYGLYRINLAEYFCHNPKHVLSSWRKQEIVQKKKSLKVDKDEDELDFTRGATPVNEKGRPTNRSWWNYLDDLKLRLTMGGDHTKGPVANSSGDDIKTWQRWYLIADGHLSVGNPRSVCTEQTSSARRNRASGFHRKLQRPPGSTVTQQDRSSRVETKTDSLVSTAVRCPKLCKGLPVRAVYASNSSAIVWYCGALQAESTDRYGGLCFLNFSDNATIFDSFEEPTLLSVSDDATHPHVLLTRSEVRLLSVNLEQESVVNKMMVYKSAAVTEALCHLNNWDHCSIPIHALEIGLKHRQLDTIAFFLKSRENMFRLKQHTAPVSLAPSPHSDLSSSNDATQLWSAMDLLCQAIADNIKEMQSKQYALQVLNLALNHLNKLIHNATDSLEHLGTSSMSSKVTSSMKGTLETSSSSVAGTPSPSPSVQSPLQSDRPQTEPMAASLVVMTEGFEGTNHDLEDIVKKLIGYTVKLRGHLKGTPSWMFPDKDEIDSGGLPSTSVFYTGTDKSMVATMHEWKSMSPQEIIRAAILKRQIPLAQTYLRKHQYNLQLEQTQQALSSLDSKGLPLLVDIGLAQVYASLLNAETETAYTMLQNLGFNVTEEIKKICLYTANTGLRDFLISKLSQSQDLTNEESEMVLFVHQLEHLYTCQSFEKAKALASEKSQRYVDEKQRHELLPPIDTDAKQYLDDIIVRGDISVSGEPANCENFNYGHVVLEWVRSWNQETRDRILLERLLASKNKDPSINYDLSADSAWSYLTSHHHWDQLKLWIRSNLSLNPDLLPPSTEAVNPWLQDLQLIPRVVHSMGSCLPDLREKILDELARHGIFSSSELATFDLLTRRLSSTQQLFQHPHPLGQRSETASVLPSYKQWFLDTCIKKNLPGLLYAFLDFYSLCLSENEVMSLQLPLAQCPWLEIMLHFRWIGRQATDPSLVFQASLSNARLLMKVTQPTISGLLESGYPIIAIATLLYAPGSIPEALSPASNDEERLWKLDGDKLQQALRPYPKLLSAVFPPSSIDGIKPQDITVYQLLQGNCPFDPRKLFLWQSTNKVINPEDTTSEMPYFSDPILIERYAYTEAFSYTYYLRQGRPSFAYVTFITSLLQEGAALTKKILFEVYVKAYTTALRHFPNRSICAACTAFIEMLGRDSLSLRIDLQTARTIADHLKGQVTHASRSNVKGQQGVGLEKSLKEKKETVERDIVNLMMSCVKGSELCCKTVLRKLEEALTSHIDQEAIERVSWKAAEEWNLAVMFCRLHGIAMTTVFPMECTRDDNWLLFICFVQTHQYPKQQVLDLVKSFKSSTIREHMSHALSHLQYGPAPSQDGESASQGGVASVRSRLPIKDYRTAYYTKMGFLKDFYLTLLVDASGETSDTEEEECKSGSRLEASQEDASSTDADTIIDHELRDVSHELFEIIFTCGNHSVAWKAFLSYAIHLQQPVLAVIAACHQGANILDCLCSWLYTSLSDDPNLEKVLGSSSLYKNHSWSLDPLRDLIDIAMATGRVTLLTKGFQIFDNRGVLNSFLAFCEDFLLLRDRNQCKIDLEFFHEAMLTCRRRSSMRNQPDPGPSRPRIGHLEWFQETANHIARNMLLSSTSQWEIGFLLEAFTALNFSRCVDSNDPNYSSLYHLHKSLQDTGLELSITRMLDSPEAMVTECKMLLNKLQAMGRFDQAKEFATAAGLSTDRVILQELLSDLKQVMRSEVGSTVTGRIAFWVKCNERLTKTKVDSQSAAEFFQSQSEENELTGEKHAREKAILLDLSYLWLSHPKSTATLSSLQSLEQKVWLWRLRAEVEKKRAVDPSPSCLESHCADWTPKSRGPRELLYDVQPIDSLPCQLLNEEERLALKDMIDGLLSSCCIARAHKLASQFGHTHHDLSIALACLQLMQGKVTPEGIDPELRSKVKVSSSKPKLTRRPSNLTLLGPPSGVYGGRSKKQLGRTPSMVSLGINQELSLPQNDYILTIMEALADHTTSARTCCDRIINIYRISQVLDKPYDVLIKQVPFTSVKSLLQTSHADRYLLAKNFIRANNLADNEVANFLSDVVLTGLQQKLKRRKESSLTRPPASEGPPDHIEKVAFMSLAKICKDPACLGTRLLDEAIQIAHSDLSTTRPALTLEVELIIRAHDCFTLSCNMEGIASVLRASCDCCNALAQSEEFSLMVRLLIGVRRFSEMTYIFEILRANHQMDALLKKGANDDKLKVALLDFLKRCDPPDTETYGIVALKFEMHREVASLLEQAARDRLKTLKSRTIDTNIEIQNILENVLHDLTNAAKNYAKDNCLRHAEKCIKQARLVALQIRLLPVRSRVINFEPAEVTKFVTQHPKFHEVLIVQDAYQQQNEWSSALYNNVILQGNFKYLEDFQSCIQLTASHCTDVASRYRQLSSKSSLVVSHMQRFLGLCPDVLTAYRLANQLEFKDMAFSLLKGDSGAYLSDVA
nr:spatacsin-like [Lytechinus pictus]